MIFPTDPVAPPPLPLQPADSVGWHVPVDPAAPVRVLLPSWTAFDVVEAGPTALVVLRDHGGTLYPGARRVVDLEAPGHRLSGLAVTVAAQGEDRLRLELDEDDRATARTLLGVLQALARAGRVRAPGSRGLPAERVEAPARIRKIFQALASSGCEARLRPGPAGGRGSYAWPVRLEEGELPLVWDLDGELPPVPIEVEVGGYNSAFVFVLDRAERTGRQWRSALPERLSRTRTRRHRREPAPAGTFASFAHPLWPELTFRRPLRELSFSGCAFLGGDPEDMLFPGLQLPEVEITAPDRAPMRFSATLRHVTPLPRGQSGACGLELKALDPASERAWLDVVAGCLYPNTRQARDEAAELWALYVDSGYFSLSGKNEAYFADLRRQFERVHSVVADAPHVAYQLSWPSSRGVEASMMLVKPYAATWLGYQLARRPGEAVQGRSGKEILRDVLFHGFEYPQRDRDFRWFVSWIQADGRFSRLLVDDLTRRWLGEREHVAMLRFRAIEVGCAGGAWGEAHWDVGPATPEEQALLVDVLAATRPKPYLEAHDLIPEHLDLAHTSRLWNEAGLTRERAVIVARRRGRVEAAAVLESAEDGLHLFGLLDVMRPFALVPGGQAAYLALTEASRAWYRRRGKSRFAIFLEDDWNGWQGAGLTDLGEADLAVISSEILPDQLEHAWEITGPARNDTERERRGMRHAS